MEFLLRFLCICLVLVLCQATDDELIVEVTNSTFDGFIEGEEMAIIEFYAPWCVHCHDLEPTFLTVAENLKPHGVKFGKVNIEEEKILKTRFSIQQLPDVRMFRKGIMYKYSGPMGVSGPEEITKYFLEEKEKDYLGENPILILTDNNFDDITATAEIILVDFYVKECLKCKKLDPIFTGAARRLSKHDPPILFGSVDVPKNMETVKRVGFQNFPILVMFRYGKLYNYTGPETEDGIVSFMIKEAGPSSLYLEDMATLKKFKNSPEESVAIGFFSSETSADIIGTYTEAGNNVRQDLRLAHTTDTKMAEKMDFEINSVVVFHPKKLVSKHETGYSVIPNIEHESSEELGRTLIDAAKPLVGQVTLDNFGTLYSHRPLVIAYYDVNWDKENIKTTQFWHSLIAEVAYKFKNTEVDFAIAQEQDFSQDLRALGLADWGEDVSIGLFGPGPKKYRMLEDLSKDSLTEFVEDYLSNDLTPYYMSEPPPRKGVGPVRTVVGSTFSKIVYDSTKNVVLKLCISSISTCQDADVWYHRAAGRYKEKDLLFGEINVEHNDIPITKLKFDDLPAILFSPKGSTGEGDLLKLDPTPEDDSDLMYWLKQEFNIKTSKTQRNEL